MNVMTATVRVEINHLKVLEGGRAQEGMHNRRQLLQFRQRALLRRLRLRRVLTWPTTAPTRARSSRNRTRKSGSRCPPSSTLPRDFDASMGRLTRCSPGTWWPEPVSYRPTRSEAG